MLFRRRNKRNRLPVKYFPVILYLTSNSALISTKEL
nr:MAG TPA: hypothetical protein [Caudoviricetes sp.]